MINFVFRTQKGYNLDQLKNKNMLQNLKNIYHLGQSLIANIYYGFPGRKLTVLGVTGTSGKTTTTLMLYEILKAAGYKVSVLSTLKAVIGGKDYDTGFHVTTPDPHILPKYLKQAIDNGDKYFVLEVSSHALDQNRAAFVPFKVGILTSFAHEHLDYHKTLANYAKAKFKLLHSAKTAILPVDVLNEELKKEVQFDKLISKMKTIGIDKGDETQKEWKLKPTLPGDYNIINSLAAATAATEVGVAKDVIVKAIKEFKGIPGRYEEIPNNKGIKLIIDFAHKPDALEAVLNVAREKLGTNSKGRVIVLYGCASERDVLKRPIMGEISGRLAEVSILTDEDPRNEDPMKILNEIAEGSLKAGAIEQKMNEEKDVNSKKHVFYKIPDRSLAIEYSINKIAKKGDILLFCGKGHEQSMNYNGVEKPWSEHSAVQKALIKK